GDGWSSGERLASGRRIAAQATLVEDLGDVAVDIGVEPVRGRKEEAALRWHGHGVADQVLEGRGTSALRVEALADLRELIRIPEEDEAARGPGCRQRVGETQLTGLVDEQDVDRSDQFGPRPHPDGARGDRELSAGEERRDLFRFVHDPDAGPCRTGLAVRLLDGSKRLAHLHERLGGLVEEIGNGAVGLGGGPDLLSGSDQCGDHSGARPRLACSGGSLDREHAVIEIEGEPDGRDEWVLPDCLNGSRRRLPAQRPQTRRSARDQVARGTQLDRSVDGLEPAAEDVIRNPAERIALDAGLDGAARDQRRGMTAQLARGPEDVDRSLDVVDVDDLTGILAESALGRVNRRPPDADPVVLWREPVPADEAALATRLEVPLVGQTADAFAGFDQSVNAQLLEPEVVP